MEISKTIIKRIKDAGVGYFSTDNISKYIKEEEIPILIDEVAGKFQEVLKSLVIDVEFDHNTKETAQRVAKSWVEEVFGGRYLPRPNSKMFPNVAGYDQLYITGPISIKSVCAHHFQNITGSCWIGVFPGENVVGLSKLSRITDWVARRPSIQEEMTITIADEIEKLTKADGVAVIIKAQHHCITQRGIKEHESDFTTSVLRGVLRNSKDLRNEFFSLLSGMKGYKLS